MSLIKDVYSLSFYKSFAAVVKRVHPIFDEQAFVRKVMGDGFEQKEWKERMKYTTTVLHSFLPDDFKEAVGLIDKIIVQLRENGFSEGALAFVIFPDYVETYGLDDFDTSVKAFESITQFVSCEFAVRPFIIRYGDRMIAEMIKWSLHTSAPVRRLASEGSRPRLPWAMAIPALKKDPQPILPILENLKADPSESVRRSVANNLNDISKDHPDVVIAIIRRWKDVSKETDGIIRHASRTLLKQGHAEVLEEHGLDAENIFVTALVVHTPETKVGEHLAFSFTIENAAPLAKKVRLEYGIYYMKANGALSRKVFKISDKHLQTQEKVDVQRKQSFKLITTRKFYVGEHKVSVIINGEEKGVVGFKLVD